MSDRPSRSGTARAPGAPSRAATAFAQAFARHQARDLAAAERGYRQALTLEPGNPDSLHLLGLVFAQTGREAEGAILMQRAVTLKPAFDLAHYNLGNVLRRLGRLEDAAAAYREAVRLKPNYSAAIVNLGAVLQTLGRMDEAVEAYRRALALSPKSAEAHYNLGVALQGMGRSHDAAQAFGRAVALKPTDPDAWANLAAVCLSLQRLPEAAAAAERWVALEPNSGEAHHLLAGAFLVLGQTDRAELSARRAHALKPGDSEIILQLGDALREGGRIAEALDAYRRAGALAPDDSRVWVRLAMGLQEAGESEAAAGAIDRALVLDPGSAAAWSVRAGLKTFTSGDPDLLALRALVAPAEARARSLEDRVELGFTLGKALMDTGDAEGAFLQLNEANRLKRATFRYDVAEDVHQFKVIAAALGAEALGRLSGGGEPSERPVFIVGMPRSGTTLVEQILASHPEVHGAGELTAFEHILIERLGPSLSPTARARRLAKLDPQDLTAIGRAYVASLAAITPAARRVTDKMPSNFKFAGLIHLALPHARIVHCRRDPVDTCLSCFARNFSRGQLFAYDQRELGLYHRAYADLMAHWRGVLPPDRFIEVDYEKVVEDLEGEARRLIAFCGLDWNGACLTPHRTARQVRTASVNQVRRPLYRSSVARWKAYEAQLGPLLEALG